jgi:uncharacterized membrane protein YdjX (TVP38/TMEM64 family)
MPSKATGTPPDAGRRTGRTVVRVLLLAAIAGVVALTGLSPEFRANLSQERVVAFLQAAGPWAPVLFVLVYAVWVTLFLPAIVPTVAGGILFPNLPALIYIVAGATLGAAASFFVARTAGRDLVARLLKGKVAQWDEGIGRNGFLFVFYLRLLYAPFTYFNFAAGLTQIRFRDFLWGTFLGIIPGTFILIFFIGRVKELAAVAAGASDRWQGVGEAGWMLVSNPRYLIPLLVFIGSFFIPVMLKRAQAAFVARRETGKIA